jgi:putative transposase
MATLHENMLKDLFENLVTKFVQDNLESYDESRNPATSWTSRDMRQRNNRNGYYKRSPAHQIWSISTIYKFPRDRKGEFQTQMFEPYQRRDGWLEEAVIQMYKSGMGTRDVARFIESMFGSHYSPTTVSNITATVLDDIQQWQSRPLQKRYSVIYLDGMYIKLKRRTVSGEVVLLCNGHRRRRAPSDPGFLCGRPRKR